MVAKNPKPGKPSLKNKPVVTRRARSAKSTSASFTLPGSTLKCLTALEKELVGKVRGGEGYEFNTTAAKQRRTIRAEVVERLVRCQPLPGEESPLGIPPKGLFIRGVIISGSLDLEACDYPARLGFIACDFDAVLILQDANLRVLNLNESSFSGLKGDGLKVEGGIFMRSVRSKGAIRLLGAKIIGNLALGGATLENTDNDGAAAGDALSLDMAEIGGSVFLDNGFYAKGAIRLLGATVKGNLSLESATLDNTNKNGTAIGNALSLDRAEIGGSAFLDNGFCAKGAVRLLGATVKGDLSLESATLENTDKNGAAAGDALNLQKLNVEGVCFLHELKATPLGHVDLRGMSATDVVDDTSLWPEPGKGDLRLDGFTYTRFLACSTDWKFRKEWLLRQAPQFLGKDFAPQPWVQCAKVLREMGHERDARLLLYHMHEARRRGMKPGWWRAWGFFLRITTGHGYRPGWSLGWITGVIVLGAIVFALAQNADRMTPAKERFYLNREAMAKYQGTGELPAGYPEFSSILYSVDVFLPIVSFAQEEHWRPANLAPEKQTGKPWWDPRSWNPNWYRLYNRLHIALGWFFTSIAVLAFSGLIKRD